MNLTIRKIRQEETQPEAKMGYALGLSLTAIGAALGLFWALTREEDIQN